MFCSESKNFSKALEECGMDGQIKTKKQRTTICRVREQPLGEFLEIPQPYSQ